MNEENAVASENALKKIERPEVIDVEAIRTVIVPSIERFLDQAAKIGARVEDDATRTLAINAVEQLKNDCITPLEKWREEHYLPEYRRTDRLRELFDNPLKEARAALKTIMGRVSDYNLKKEREARLEQERREAEARRQQEEAERKRREAEEAERRRLQAIEDEKRKAREAEEAEERRIKAEKEAEERRLREIREAAAAETARRLKEEEESRLLHAQVAEAEGNGAAKVDTILETTTAISPVLAKPEQAKDQETLRLEQEQARRLADERAVNEAHDSALAEDVRRAAEQEAARKTKEAQAAAASAAAAQAAVASASNAVSVREDSRTMSVERWVWELDSDGTAAGDRAAMYTLLEAILKTRGTANEVPLEFIGYDNDHPEKFRPSEIGAAVTRLKDRFKCPGIRAYPQRDERLRAKRPMGGRR